ncbi:MAG: ferredoxin--NADP(+) reductase [Leptospiraceae bacterium]|nr:MAG: ferredoxin--NADP(+) reductase [Leptospiraceae bacterium]
MKTIENFLPPYAKLISATDMIYKPKNPLKVKTILNKKLVPDDYEEDVRHIIFDLKNTDYVYTEGQSLGVLPPGTDENGKPHKLRLYSIASPFDGDPDYPDTVSLCVKRVIYKDEQGKIIKGVCSNYLCDLKEGDEVFITGPAGKHFVLPEDPDTDLIFFATGTGIAPFRAFLFKIFHKDHKHNGSINLFFGTRYKKDHLYANEINKDLLDLQNEQFKIYSALSRENPEKKVYVHHLLYDKKQEIEKILDKNNYIVYICGLKGMEEPISLFFKQYFEHKYNIIFSDEEWVYFLRQLMKQNRLIIETY